MCPVGIDIACVVSSYQPWNAFRNGKRGCCANDTHEIIRHRVIFAQISSRRGELSGNSESDTRLGTTRGQLLGG